MMKKLIRAAAGVAFIAAATVGAGIVLDPGWSSEPAQVQAAPLDPGWHLTAASLLPGDPGWSVAPAQDPGWS
ncbi:hypothetical protein [Streptomyces vietnamensis]|uniref:Uncharacterized protein n=1 Tax=Streptomyces vietnamensis TaxID=362257 RepID=A0A0B5I8H5_9ACTN|nr:hypothetical protein [Streptomyces vietnamensis]AJF65963.1 hypothetical protein SVTN_17765 [Streptomyces vietnamensis]